MLRDHGYGAAFGTLEWRQRPAFIQSFEVNNLKWLRQHTDIPLLQLMDEAHESAADTDVTYGEMMRDDGLAAIAQYAKGIGPWKGTMVPSNGSGANVILHVNYCDCSLVCHHDLLGTNAGTMCLYGIATIQAGLICSC